ncbi:integrase core domain-containing protein [Methylobacterium phyllosphaerae]
MRPAIPKRRAKSSAGTKRSRTASCSNTPTCPAELEARVVALVEHYNHARAHESLGNHTPADVYFGRGETILHERARIKRQTLMDRRLRHHAQAA